MKNKWKKIFVIIIFIICLISIIICLYNIIKWSIDNKHTEKQIENINKIVTIVEVENKEDTKDNEVEDEVYNFDPYNDYNKMNLISVDFNELKDINSDTIGWIQVNGTNVNYPFVQGTDNNFYLNHSYDKSYNAAGWVFMDYRNNRKTFDKNTIIYGHARVDKTMFGSLKYINSNGWLNNPNNFVIKLSTEYENTLWQVFSSYHIPTTSDYLKINFLNNEDFMKFVKKLKDRSMYNYNTNVNEKDKILTLSTCYDNGEKTVIHAKLIKKETR